MKKSLFILFLSMYTLVEAQNAVYPNNGTLYDGSLHKVELIMHPDTLAALLAPENRWTDHSYPATFVYDNIDTLAEVGVRMKGNTSRNSRKLSFKIDMDEFKNQNYQGLKTFNLNGNHNDPSMCREVLSTNVMSVAGNVSLRANPVQLYLNGNLRGIYTNAEQVNKKFLDSRFGENSGNLYKCSWPAELNWLGSDPQLYKNVINPSPLNERAYELKTNESADDYSDLVHLLNVINNTPSAQFEQAIDSVFDVYAYLKVLAAEVLIGHWDNYFYNKNNYYLYHHQGTGKFIYMPYDMDNTFGVQWGVSDIDQRNINAWGNLQQSKAPLTYKILAVPGYKLQYETYISELCDSAFGETRLFALMDSLKAKLAPAVAADPFFTGADTSDYGYTITDWQNSFTQAIDDHATFGLKPYVSNRRSSALQQISHPSGIAETTLLHAKIYPNPSTDYVTITHDEKALQVSIIDLSGKTILERQSIYSGQSLSLQGIDKGMYILRLSNNSDQVYSRLIIE
jgi:spore coat protein H